MNEYENIQCGNKMDQLFTRQIDLVSSYILYLSQIKTTISNNQTELLNELLEKQLVNPQQIEESQQLQAEILDSYGFEQSEHGLNKCIQQCDNRTQLTALKSTLTENLKELEKSLLINTILVQKSQHRVKQSIRLLSGHNLSNTISSYSQNGHIDSPSGTQKTLAQA